MSIRTPPTLVQLAGESLLRDQALAIAALEHLPAELFPQLFIQAYKSERHQVLTAKTEAWPFTVLPLGSLKQPPSVQVLKAVLDGLDLLLPQEVRPRRCKLRVLDLRNRGSEFWRMWCGDSIQKLSPMILPLTEHRSSPNKKHPLAPVEVFLDLNFYESDSNAFFMSVIHWAQQREGQLHLCCKKLRIAAVTFQRVRKVLDAVQLDCVQELVLNCTWDLPTLGKFALYMGQMRNLQRLLFFQIHVLGEEEQNWEEEDEQDWVEELEWGDEEQQDWEEEEERETEEQEEQISFSQFLSQMLSPLHLLELDMDSPSFLRGCIDQMLRCLQTPLEQLTITHCPHFTHSDLTHLFQCPNLRQLRSLRVYCVSFRNFSPEPLRALLEAVAPTLQVLSLDNCAMVDSQVEAILPVLRRCHQIRLFTISENPLSVATVGKLVSLTAGLCSLDMQLYPIPSECYTTQGTVNQERLGMIRAALTEILRELGQPRTILLVTKHREQREYYYVPFSCQGARAVPL